LIRSTVWPQCTNVTDRQDRQRRQTGNGPIAQGEQFYKRSPKKRFRVPGIGTGSGTLEPVPWNRFLRQINNNCWKLVNIALRYVPLNMQQ